MTNNCLYCKSRITVEDLKQQISSGVLHVHYCGECIITCITCCQPKPKYAFGYDQKSQAYQLWYGRNMIPFPAPLDAFQTTCSQCVRERRQKQIHDALVAEAAIKLSRLEAPQLTSLRDKMRQRQQEVAKPR
jgi:hypothetical protein